MPDQLVLNYDVNFDGVVDSAEVANPQIINSIAMDSNDSTTFNSAMIYLNNEYVLYEDIIVNKEFADEFTSVSEEAEEFPHGFTAGGHPVGCAIALKAIDVIINEGLLDNVKSVSPYFHQRLNEFNDYDNIGETRGVGLMAALEMVKDKKNKKTF